MFFFLLISSHKKTCAKGSALVFFFIQVIASLWALNNLVSYVSMIRASNSDPWSIPSWNSFHAQIRPAPFHDISLYALPVLS